MSRSKLGHSVKCSLVEYQTVQVRDFGRMAGGWHVCDFGRSDSLYSIWRRLQISEKNYSVEVLYEYEILKGL